jgi:hypothetical protein
MRVRYSSVIPVQDNESAKKTPACDLFHAKASVLLRNRMSHSAKTRKWHDEAADAGLEKMNLLPL